MIHSTAIVEPGARLAANVVVGAYSLIGARVAIGEGCVIGPHVVIEGRATIGRNNHIRQFASLGGTPQDKKYTDEDTSIEIGDGNTIHEYVTINRGTAGDASVTRLGDDNWIMAYVHLAHDCQVGSHTIFANASALAGHVQVGDWAVLGAATMAHQFVRIGAHSHTGIGTYLDRDLPPYVKAAGNMAQPYGINSIGLRRRGVPGETIEALKRAYRTIYRNGLGLEEARRELEAQAATCAEVRVMAEFLDASKRGIIRVAAETGSETRVHVGMVAAEASGDLLAAHLIAALRERRPALRFSGIGGPKMIAQGFESHVPLDRLGVRGYVEVLRHYRAIMGIRRQIAERMLRERPAVFIGVDSSDFNLGLERKLKDAGIPAIQYVSPSIWALRGWRKRRIARSATHLLALFPFEPALYENEGLPVTYVGHPLADMIPMDPDKAKARADLRVPAGRRVVALLPGSRRSELHYMADLFVLTARRLLQDLPDAHFVCPTASRETRDMFEAALRRHEARDLPLTLLFGHSHEALAAADIALVASGTATLETALLKTSMVITYRQSPFTWALMRRMKYLPYVGLPNILAAEQLVPEFIQENATPGKLANALLDLLHDTAAQRRQVEKFREIHATLRQNTAQKAADAVLAVMDGGRS